MWSFQESAATTCATRRSGVHRLASPGTIFGTLAGGPVSARPRSRTHPAARGDPARQRLQGGPARLNQRLGRTPDGLLSRPLPDNEAARRVILHQALDDPEEPDTSHSSTLNPRWGVKSSTDQCCRVMSGITTWSRDPSGSIASTNADAACASRAPRAVGRAQRSNRQTPACLRS